MRWFFTVLIALAAGFAGSALWDLSGLGDRSTRAFLLANPEVLPEAMEVLQRREQTARIEPLRGELETPVINELASVLAHATPGHVILIDDARLFDGTNDYPTMDGIRDMIGPHAGRRLSVERDIIRIVPGAEL